MILDVHEVASELMLGGIEEWEGAMKIDVFKEK